MIHQDPALPASYQRNPHLEVLRKVPLFSHLSPVQLVALYRRMTIKRWYGGAIIVGQYEPGEALYVLVKGQAKTVLFGDNGREVTIAHLRPGDSFGEMALVDGQPRATNVIAADDVVLLRLSRQAFFAHMEGDPRTTMGLLRQISARARRAVDMIDTLALHDVSSRLQRTLVAMAEELGEPAEGGLLIRRRPTQQELANMVGTCRETVSRTLTAMARKGLVKSRGRTLLLSHALLDSLQEAA